MDERKSTSVALRDSKRSVENKEDSLRWENNVIIPLHKKIDHFIETTKQYASHT